MPGIPAPRTGHRAGRSGSLRSPLLAAVLVPSLGLAAAWGYAAYLLRDSGQRTALLAGSAVVAAVVLISLVRGIRTAWALSARLSELRADTMALAEQEIPEVVGRLRAGEQVPAPAAWTPSRRTGDDVQQASEGLAAVRQAAVAAIVHQAQGREGTKKVFLNIARRTQILIHRQISMLDALEREHEDPELLRELFAVDHLATRMRRNAENLVILGGDLPARRWRNAVPVVNVLRSAVSETESYSRVVVRGVPRVSLGGQAVADVIHLVAELIENGTTFSPPYTQVQISAKEVPEGLAVEVEDRGLGMTETEYQRLNAYLADPPDLDVSALGDDLRLGLFVVAHLAARHDVRVTLHPSPYGGTRAAVLVPSALLEQAAQSAAVSGLPSGARITRAPVTDVGAGAGAGADAGAEAGVGGGSGSETLGQEPPGATAAGHGGLPDGSQAAPGPFGTPGAPAVPYGADGAGAAAGTGAGTGAAGVGGAEAPANGGLAVGAEIPGLPGAVVVPRPVLPRMYDLSGSPAVDQRRPAPRPDDGSDSAPHAQAAVPQRARDAGPAGQLGPATPVYGAQHPAPSAPSAPRRASADSPTVREAEERR
ncbi:ATP-binding protein [Kitasatospora sp. NPDC056800]|uniref:ATP-binding protein n=1 Tax=Kitasatospora sp. NPDC056800 TaxID=3345948 RepID=UPI0036B36F45